VRLVNIIHPALLPNPNRHDLNFVQIPTPNALQVEDVVGVELDIETLLNPRQRRPHLTSLLPKLPEPLGRQTKQRHATIVPQKPRAEHVLAAQQRGERDGEMVVPVAHSDEVVHAVVAAADEAGAAEGAEVLCRVCVQRLVEAVFALDVAARASIGRAGLGVEVLGADEARGAVEVGLVVHRDCTDAAVVLEEVQCVRVRVDAQVVHAVGLGFPLGFALECSVDHGLDAARRLRGLHLHNVQPHVLLLSAALGVLHGSFLDPIPVSSISRRVYRAWQTVVDAPQLGSPVGIAGESCVDTISEGMELYDGSCVQV
jgi:hypothetical protein